MAFRLSPLFVVRVAGVSFERLDRLATPRSVQGARALRAAEVRLIELSLSTLAALRKPDPALPAKLVDRARRAIGQHHRLPKDAVDLTPEVARYNEYFNEIEAMRDALASTLDEELTRTRQELADAAAGPLKRWGVFASSATVGARLSEPRMDGQGRGKRERASDRLQLNYLQRVCAKNDTISEFGPTAWGWLSEKTRGITIAPVPGISRRHVFLEKWVTTELCAAMTSDPEARPEACPVREPLGTIEGDVFVRSDLGVTRVLDASERAVLAQLDGKTPAHAIADQATLERLAADGVVCWAFEAPVLDADRALAVLDDIRRWREGPARTRWLPVVENLVSIPDQFAEGSTEQRAVLMEDVESIIESVAGARKERGRTLYAAANAIGEDCLRSGTFELGQDLADAFLADASPWLSMFRDITAHSWRHVQKGLANLFASASPSGAPVRLPKFLHHAEDNGVPLNGDGITRLANEPFMDVAHAFEAYLGSRADAPEIELTAEDYAFVRRRFSPPPATLWPCVDLQVAAASADAVTRGDFSFVIGEVNSFCPVAAHVFFWGCPDRAHMAAEMRRLSRADRACHAYLGALDRGNHVTFHWPEIFGDKWTSLVRERSPAGARHVAPGDASVQLVDGEVRVFGPDGADLGSLVHEWDMPFALGIHPFTFRREPHFARMRAGRTILQRRQWTISAQELPGCPYSGVSPGLIAAIDRLRSDRGLPRHVFVRPSEHALSDRTSATGRDKDAKPFYVDFESYLFCEAFDHRLAKYAELEVVEMLPSPDQLLWQDEDGRRTFEMRILCSPT